MLMSVGFRVNNLQVPVCQPVRPPPVPPASSEPGRGHGGVQETRGGGGRAGKRPKNGVRKRCPVWEIPL